MLGCTPSTSEVGCPWSQAKPPPWPKFQRGPFNNKGVSLKFGTHMRSVWGKFERGPFLPGHHWPVPACPPARMAGHEMPVRLRDTIWYDGRSGGGGGSPDPTVCVSHTAPQKRMTTAVIFRRSYFGSKPCWHRHFFLWRARLGANGSCGLGLNPNYPYYNGNANA